MVEEWPEAALSLLDSMWGLDTHMTVMRRRLMPLLGFMPEAVDVRIMAGRHKSPSKALVASVAPSVAPAPTEDSSFFVRSERHPDRVRRVAPGTYPVPAGGFRMGRGR